MQPEIFRFADFVHHAGLDREAETLFRRAIELALGGDTVALRLCLERIMAPRRDRPVRFKLPELGSAHDAMKALAAITVAVGRGDLTPSEAAELSRLVEAYVTAVEATELDHALQAMGVELCFAELKDPSRGHEGVHCHEEARRRGFARGMKISVLTNHSGRDT